MSSQTVTRAVESDFEPGEIYKVLAEVSNIPKWAPVFADAIERIDDTHFSVTKNGANFGMELLVNEAAGTVDYVREMPINRRGGAYIRVTPRPLGGSAISMTVPVAPTTTESDVAKVVDQELVDLVRLVRS
jgi:Polyketide cyclase / dehydrase and lipid transport